MIGSILEYYFYLVEPFFSDSRDDIIVLAWEIIAFTTEFQSLFFDTFPYWTFL